MIKSISIHGLRGFGERREIDFAIPNGVEGSGITFLVGSNNSGKTTLLEALRSFNCYTHNPPSFSERKRNKKCENGKVHLLLTNDDETNFSIDTADRGGSPTVLRKNGGPVSGEWNPPTIFALQSRRFVEYEFHRNEMNRPTINKAITITVQQYLANLAPGFSLCTITKKILTPC